MAVQSNSAIWKARIQSNGEWTPCAAKASRYFPKKNLQCKSFHDVQREFKTWASLTHPNIVKLYAGVTTTLLPNEAIMFMEIGEPLPWYVRVILLTRIAFHEV